MTRVSRPIASPWHALASPTLPPTAICLWRNYGVVQLRGRRQHESRMSPAIPLVTTVLTVIYDVRYVAYVGTLLPLAPEARVS